MMFTDPRKKKETLLYVIVKDVYVAELIFPEKHKIFVNIFLLDVKVFLERLRFTTSHPKSNNLCICSLSSRINLYHL